ncbi:MAG: alkaline phosphatase [Alphaproteobacteria bacterium]|nr:alkaline phosphatase [Alphaproteobacteria bacterium]
MSPILHLLLALLACKGEPAPESGPTVDTDGTPDSLPPDETDEPGDSDSAGDSDTGTHASTGAKVILMIGDGMGPGQLATASLYAHGEEGQLHLQALPVHAQVRTASLSGITDSAASATAMATGVITLNGRLGMDADQLELQSLVELAQSRGMSAGVVSTAAITHATPAAFTSHEPARFNYINIADDQALQVLPDLALGGGLSHFLPSDDERSARGDDGLIAPLEDAGCEVVTDRDALAAASGSGCLFGLFAESHLDYVVDRPEDSAQPTLSEMTAAALERLDADPDGFFLMIEGARIDMASHGNDLRRAVGETLDFDAVVADVAAWAADRPEVTLIVTADHECGGLEVVTPGEAGALSEVDWRWTNHTNARIDLYAMGAEAEALDGQLIDHTWVYALASARLTGQAFLPPAETNIPDGHFSDLMGPVASQRWTTGFGEGYNQLDGLYLDADAFGLSIGLEGLFEWDRNAAVVLLDVDPGEGTGLSALDGALSDTSGAVDTLLGGLPLDAASVGGFRADLAAVSLGGQEVDLYGRSDVAGVRVIGQDPSDLFWMNGTINFGEAVRVDAAALSAVSGEGMELLLPWEALYPDLFGAVPANARVRVVALLTSEDAYLSNQFLPALADGEDNPGEALTALPGYAEIVVDSDGDGVGDGGGATSAVP